MVIRMIEDWWNLDNSFTTPHQLCSLESKKEAGRKEKNVKEKEKGKLGEGWKNSMEVLLQLYLDQTTVAKQHGEIF